MLIGFIFHLFIIIDIVNSGSLDSISINSVKSKKIKKNDEKENKKSHSTTTTSHSNHRSILKTVISMIKMTRLLLKLKIPTNQNFKESPCDNNHSTFSSEKSTKSSELLIPKDMKDDPLLKEIFESLYLVMPLVLVKIIGDYANQGDSIIEYFDRITNKLKGITLNLYDIKLMPQLLSLIKGSKEAIPPRHEFWNDLSRFLFKYALEMREKFADNDQLFQKSTKSIKDIVIIANKNVESALFNFKLEPMTDFDFFLFGRFTIYEILDHPHLLALFVNKIVDKEGNLKMTINEIEKRYCSGSFNNNPLLKLMIIRFAFGSLSVKQMKKKGWITDEDENPRDSNSAIALYHIYSIKGEEEHEDKVGAIEILQPFYLSQFTIKFFIDNRLGFRMYHSSNLVQFLKRLEYIGGLPEGSSISRIIKFRDEKDGKVFKWDKNIFEKYLTERIKENRISQEEFDRFIKLIE